MSWFPTIVPLVGETPTMSPKEPEDKYKFCQGCSDDAGWCYECNTHLVDVAFENGAQAEREKNLKIIDEWWETEHEHDQGGNSKTVCTICLAQLKEKLEREGK